MDPNDWVWDVENWPMRVAEALDYAAELKGNTLVYGTAEEYLPSLSEVELIEPPSVREIPLDTEEE